MNVAPGKAADASPRGLRWQPIVLLVLLTLALTTLAAGCILAISAARTFISGESLWTRAQKLAVVSLMRYSESRDEADWIKYEQALVTVDEDRKLRDAADAPRLDRALAQRHGVAAGNHPQDVAGAITMYRWFRDTVILRDAIAAWRAADQEIEQLQKVALELRQAVQRGATQQQVRALRERIQQIDDRITPLVHRFWLTLGESWRLLVRSLMALLLFGATVLVLLVGAALLRMTRKENDAARALHRSESLFRSLWLTTSDAVLIFDAAGRVRFANPSADELAGVPHGALVGERFERLQPPALRSDAADALDAYLRGGRPTADGHGSESLLLRADGTLLPVEVRRTRLSLDDGLHTVVFARDIARRRAAEQEVVQAQRRLVEVNESLERRVAERTQELSDANQRLRELDRMKSEFLATMSHELRTPLNSILGFAALLHSGASGALSEEQRRQIGFIHGSGRHLLALINDLLDLSRIESGRMEVARERYDFAEVADEVATQLEPLAAAKGIALHVNAEPGLEVVGDRRKAMQVLLNLSNNALKFTSRGEVRIDARFDGDELVAEVADTGVGIAPHDMQLLFQPFRQLDGSLDRTHEGTGLGLYLCSKLLNLMGGSISVHSAQGQGSRFGFRLPRQAAVTLA